MEESSIRVRACLAVIDDGKILLVPHFDTDRGPVQWNIPGGMVNFEESIQQAAVREILEETGLQAKVDRLLDVSEVLLPERPWHSVTITFLGQIIDGKLQAEQGHPYGQKLPRWFTVEELEGLSYHPKDTVDKAFLDYSSDKYGQKQKKYPLA